MMKKLISKSEAERLFYGNSCLLGSNDAITYKRTAELLGEDAVAFARRMASRELDCLVGYGTGANQVGGFSLWGFFHAVSYYNVSAISEEGNKGES